MFDTEKFISEIEKHPALYNIKLKSYRNRDLKARLWHQVAAAMFKHWDDLTVEEQNEKEKQLQVKWKSIRDQCKKCINSLKNKKVGQGSAKAKKYMYFDQLSFMIPILENRNRPSNKEHVDTGEETNSEYWAESSKDQSQAIPGSACDQLLEQTTIGLDSHRKRREEKDVDKMGNKAFLMSLLPLLNNIPRHEIINTRLRIMQALQHDPRQNTYQYSEAVYPGTSYCDMEIKSSHSTPQCSPTSNVSSAKSELSTYLD